MKTPNIPLQINLILKIFLASLLVILARVWYLSVVQHDAYYEESRKPQRRCIVEQVDRGSIRDRFNVPLAINKMQYNAAICYADIRQIPRVVRNRDESGKKRRVMARREHVEKLSHFLAQELDMDPQEIEDTIYGKACLFPHTPFVLKEDISEELFYKLKMQEKDWLGILMQRTVKRVYPQGKLACDVIGYMGAIGQKEYLRIAQEIEELQLYLSKHESEEAIFLPQGFSTPQEVQNRLQELEEKAYTINDQVGKTGVEATFDEQLRGRFGKKIYEIDIKGNTLSALPGGRPAIAGSRLILSLSSELQKEAEVLLTKYEQLQDERDKGSDRRTPWQRGGAIVAMHPKTGEILALASYPRFNPNDLVPAKSFEKRQGKRASIIQWLESESYIGEIWDGKRPMQRERFANGEFFIDELPLTWEVYLDTILPKKGPLRDSILALDTIGKAFHIQENPEEQALWLSHIPNKRDKQLVLDLAQMVAKKECFSPSLLKHVEDQTIADFRLFSQTLARHLNPLKELVRKTYHDTDFKQWRETHFKSFLRNKRRLEKAKRSYARPYTEYLEKKEREMFTQFWKNMRWHFVHAFVLESNTIPYASEVLELREGQVDPMLDLLKELLLTLEKEDQFAYLQALRSFDDLDQPLTGKYRSLRKKDGTHYEKHLAAAFYPYTGFGMGRSQAFRQASPMGSIFKLVPAYAGLRQQYIKGAEDLNPLTLTDDMQWTAKPGSNTQVLGFLSNGDPIKRLYKGGRLPRAYPQIGKLDVVKAIERTSNIYFSILAGDVLESPGTLLDTAMEFGLGNKTGIDLPGEYKGALPDDIVHNKTGLYAFAIGQHSLVTTPLQTAVMLSAIANGGKILKPQIAKFTASEEGNITFWEPEVKDTLFLPDEVRAKLLKGMQQTINGEKGSARLSKIRSSFHDKNALKAYREIHSQMAGKTGTAEILYKQSIDAESRANMEKHVWFGCIGFEDETMQEPELVVVVYSRFGTAGKQGAPIAANLIKKWREIKHSHSL